MKSKLKVAFTASIIVNFLLIGVLLGSLRGAFSATDSRRGRFAAEIEKLPEPARSRFRERIMQPRSEDPLREEMRQARNRAIELLIAEPFDQASYQRQLNRVNQLRANLAMRMSEDLRNILKDLPPEQRAAVGEMLKRPPARTARSN